MKIRPLHDRVVVRPNEADEMTAGGLFIPDNAKEKPARGTVIAVGEGKRDEDGHRIALDVNVGDEVLYGKYAGNELKVEGEKVFVLREDEIFAIVQKETA